jgi:hypothetical protein
VPYNKAIERLKMLNMDKSSQAPIQKLNILGEMTRIIKEEIADFWRGVKIEKETLAYDADTLLLIYIYIIAKAKVFNIFAHLHICSEFSTPYLMTTRVGYCYTTMEVALSMLIDNDNLVDTDKLQRKSH